MPVCFPSCPATFFFRAGADDRLVSAADWHVVLVLCLSQMFEGTVELMLFISVHLVDALIQSDVLVEEAWSASS